MKNWFLVLVLIFTSVAFAQEKKKNALDQCAYDTSVKILKVVKETVGLQNERQLIGVAQTVHMMCVQRQQLDQKLGLNEDETWSTIERNLILAVKDVFEGQDI